LATSNAVFGCYDANQTATSILVMQKAEQIYTIAAAILWA